MSEPKWTPAQRAAIEDRGGALLVSAAAGSGKTAVLTERAVRLITDPEHPVDADRLLIVTFTNAAAAELRARIGQALLKRSQAEPGNGALRRQRMLLQRAPICTIDAFCLDLLRKHFQALDIPPDFSPADPGSVEKMKRYWLSSPLNSTFLPIPLLISMSIVAVLQEERTQDSGSYYQEDAGSEPARRRLRRVGVAGAELPIYFHPSDQADHRTDGVNQFRPRFKIRGDHLRGFGDTRLPVSLRHCAHGSEYAGRRE